MLDVDHMGDRSERKCAAFASALCACILDGRYEFHGLGSVVVAQDCFLHYSRGEVFSAHALRLMKNIAIAIFAGVSSLSRCMHPYLWHLTWYLGHGHREISLDFGSGDVTSLFTAGVVLVISRVMAEAQRAADENTKFI
jgi:hypothetical protein